MKIKNIFFVILFLPIVLNSCEKDAAMEDKSTGTKITAELKKDSEKISQVTINTYSKGIASTEIVIGQNHVDVIDSGKVMWFHFDAKAGDLYEVSWQDSWWEKYTAGSIYVTAYEEDKSTLYFDKERLIQMIGSPKIISVEKQSRVYLKVEGYDKELSGSFAVNVNSINKADAPLLPCDSSLAFSVSKGETKLYKAQVQKDSTYSIEIEGSQYIGAYGDEIEVKVSAFREGLNAYYFMDERAVSPVYNNGQPNIQTFTAKATETVYLGVMGAYWWEPRIVNLSLVCQ